MKVFILLGFTIISAWAGSQEKWTRYKDNYGKKYRSDKEDNHRMTIFLANKAKIIVHNLKYDLGLVSYKMKINHMSDMETSEVNIKLNGYDRDTTAPSGRSFRLLGHKAADAIDWRQKGAVTPVKAQGMCASCWAFSAIGSLEGQHFLKTGKLVSLSEQDLIDCSVKFGNKGCKGGSVDQAFRYIKAKGVDTESAYPYLAENGICKNKNKSVGATVRGYVYIPPGDEETLKIAVGSVGPISAAIDASQPSFHNYGGGIYDELSCSSTELVHGVTIVGYGTERGRPYWLVKNSWGPSWGDNGYIKMSRNSNNQCGIASFAFYPVVH